MSDTPNIITGNVTRRARVRYTPNWLKAIYAVLITFLVVIIAALILSPVPEDNTLPPCKSESDTSCYWDADTQGNGRGHDFVNR